MFYEVQETVRFLSSFMYGRIPRSRVKSFCGHLLSLLTEAIDEKDEKVERFDLIVFADGQSDETIVQAARRAYVHLKELQECMNNGLIIEITDGRVRALTPYSAQIVFPKPPNSPTPPLSSSQPPPPFGFGKLRTHYSNYNSN